MDTTCSILLAGLRLLCGPTGVEDMVRLEGTPWLVGSGMAEANVAGRVHLINSRTRQWQVIYPASASRAAHDAKRFPGCSSEPDAAKFGAHGIALHRSRNGQLELLAVNHGREAIEYFSIDNHSDAPQLHWIGCVMMPADASINSVAALSDGGFVATQFYTPSQGGMAVIQSGALTGGLFEWHPGKTVTVIDGIRLSGANGIEVADGGKLLYVAAWGSREILRIDRSKPVLQIQRIAVDFAPDNLRWSADHHSLLVAGQLFAPGGGGPVKLEGWKVLRLDARTLAPTAVAAGDANSPMQGVSVAVEVDDQLWIGPFRGDRIASLQLAK